MYKKIIINNLKINPIKAGHPWVFSGALVNKFNAKTADIVKLYSENNIYLATGFYNASNSIAFRAISFNETDIIDEDFIFNKLEKLKKFKEQLLPENTNAYRLVNAEGDYLPGVIIDVYDTLAVFQLSLAGSETLKNLIVNALKKLQFEVIVEKSDSSARLKEGLKIKDPEICYAKNVVNNETNYKFLENSMQLLVNPILGQKTGFFLDQRQARSFVNKISKDKVVVNLFSYTGAFSMAALLGKAKYVLSVDVSKTALNMFNNMLNNDNYKHFNDNSKVIESDVFDFLNNNYNLIINEIKAKDNEKILICDPPAFAKNMSHLKNAINAYIKLNALCLEKLNSGDIFITSSCSGLIKMDDFLDIIKKASLIAGKKLIILKEYKEDVDHTAILGFKEGNYLKTLVFKIL